MMNNTDMHLFTHVNCCLVTLDRVPGYQRTALDRLVRAGLLVIRECELTSMGTPECPSQDTWSRVVSATTKGEAVFKKLQYVLQWAGRHDNDGISLLLSPMPCAKVGE